MAPELTVSVYGRELDKRLRELGRRVTPRQGKKREKGQPTPEDTWERRFDESLRIVDAGLAARADAKLLNRRERYLASVAKADVCQSGRTASTCCLAGCSSARRAAGTSRASGGGRFTSAPRGVEGPCLPEHVGTADGAGRQHRLDMVEEAVLGTRMIEELLAMVNKGEEDRHRCSRQTGSVYKRKSIAWSPPSLMVARLPRRS